jgi:HEAT repeat protein
LAHTSFEAETYSTDVSDRAAFHHWLPDYDRVTLAIVSLLYSGKPMKLRRSLRVGIVLGGLFLAAVATWFAWLLPAYLRGEHFYQGRPTSHWKVEIVRSEDDSDSWSMRLLNKCLDCIGMKPRSNRPAVLHGDLAALPVLMDLLDDDDETVRIKALSGISAIGKGGKPALAAVRSAAVEDASARVRPFAVRAYQSVASQEEFVDLLLVLLKVSQPEMQREYLCYLHDCGGAGKRAVPMIVPLLNDEVVRREAALALAGISGDDSQSIDLLTRTLLGWPPVERAAIASFLWQDGHKLALAVPAFAEVFHQGDMRDRLWATEALGLVGGEDATAIPVLIEGLKDSSSDVRAEAARLLGLVGPSAKQALPALSRLAADRDSVCVKAAIEAIDAIDPKAEKKKSGVKE